MRAAIYARRSTDEHQEESLQTQSTSAREFIAKKGSRHLYEEDGVSRAEFVERPALTTLKHAVSRGEIDIIVTRDESRIGGDMLRTTELIQSFVQSKVAVHYYYNDKRVKLSTTIDRLLMVVRNFGAEHEREKISERTHEILFQKAKAGLVTGGTVYGYDSVRRPEGGVVRAINEEQARVVLRIFERATEGDKSAGAPALRELFDQIVIGGLEEPTGARSR